MQITRSTRTVNFKNAMMLWQRSRQDGAQGFYLHFCSDVFRFIIDQQTHVDEQKPLQNEFIAKMLYYTLAPGFH